MKQIQYLPSLEFSIILTSDMTTNSYLNWTRYRKGKKKKHNWASSPSTPFSFQEQQLNFYIQQLRLNVSVALVNFIEFWAN